MQTAINHGATADSERFQRVRDLIGDYPDIDRSEAEEILHFLKKGPAIDNALLSSADDIRPQLERFHADHRKELDPGLRTYAILTTLIALFVIAIILLWDAGVK